MAIRATIDERRDSSGRIWYPGKGRPAGNASRATGASLWKFPSPTSDLRAW